MKVEELEKILQTLNNYGVKKFRCKEYSVEIKENLTLPINLGVGNIDKIDDELSEEDLLYHSCT